MSFLTAEPMIPYLPTIRKSGKTSTSDSSCACAFGLVNPPAPTNMLPLYEARLAQYLAGGLAFCACEQGRNYQLYLSSLAANHKSDGQRVEEARLTQLWKNAGVPQQYALYTLKGYSDLCGKDAGKQEAIKALVALQRDAEYKGKFGLVLWGEPGVGKTGALSPLFVHLLRNGCAGVWIQYNELMASLRDFESGEVEQRVQKYKTIEYLFIDDLGDPLAEAAATPYARECLMRIVDYRKNSGRPILATSNLNLEQMEQQFHKRIVQRLTETCNVIEVKGRVLRK